MTRAAPPPPAPPAPPPPPAPPAPPAPPPPAPPPAGGWLAGSGPAPKPPITARSRFAARPRRERIIVRDLARMPARYPARSLCAATPSLITARSSWVATMMDTCAPAGVPNYPLSSGCRRRPRITARSGRLAAIVGTFAASGPATYPQSPSRRPGRRITARSAPPAKIMGRCAPSGVPNDPSSSAYRAVPPTPARCVSRAAKPATQAGSGLITARCGGVPPQSWTKP